MGLLVDRSCVLGWELAGRLDIRGRMGLIVVPFGCQGSLYGLAWVESLGSVVKLDWVLWLKDLPFASSGRSSAAEDRWPLLYIRDDLCNVILHLASSRVWSADPPCRVQKLDVLVIGTLNYSMLKSRSHRVGVLEEAVYRYISMNVW